jgi:hypothetical protein
MGHAKQSAIENSQSSRLFIPHQSHFIKRKVRKKAISIAIIPPNVQKQAGILFIQSCSWVYFA